MNLILDEGLPLRAAVALRQAGIEARHVLELGMGGASDQAILERARRDGATVVTLDADFHQILATTGASLPSVVRVRIASLPVADLVILLLNLLSRTGDELRAGAAVSVERHRVRLRKLPIRS